VDEDQMLFEIHGLILALHYEARFLQPRLDPAATRALTTSWRATAPAAPARRHPATVSSKPHPTKE
jgi:hypothetical protein